MRRLVLVLVVVTTLAACGSSSKKSSPSSSNTTSPTTAPHVAGTGPGVTATQINLGIVLIDFKCIPGQFVGNEERPGQQQAYDAFINDLNAKGGINGRKIKPFYKTVCPLTNTPALAACTAFADDDNVFAVLGTFGDINDDSDLCMTKTHKRVLITYDLNQGLIDKAPKGLLLTPDILPDRRVKVMISLLGSQHILDGKTVAILADSSATDRVKKVIQPGLKKLGMKTGSTGVITVTNTDTSAAQSQLDAFIERWRTENVNAIFLAGDGAETTPFVSSIRKAFPGITLISDSTGIETNAQGEVKAGVKPNPFEGVITAEGRTGLEHTQTQHYKDCAATYEAQTHITVPSPNAVITLPDGRTNNIYGEEEDACVFVNMFATIATKVGPDLNNANWQSTVDTFGTIDIRSTDFASLHAGKYDADDTYGLVAFDSSIPQSGDWKRVTPIENVGNAS